MVAFTEKVTVSFTEPVPRIQRVIIIGTIDVPSLVKKLDSRVHHAQLTFAHPIHSNNAHHLVGYSTVLAGSRAGKASGS